MNLYQFCSNSYSTRLCLLHYLAGTILDLGLLVCLVITTLVKCYLTHKDLKEKSISLVQINMFKKLN